MRGNLGQHCNGRHVVIDLAANAIDFIKAHAFFRGRTCDLVHQHAAAQAATLFICAGTNLFGGDDLLDCNAFRLCKLFGHVSTHHVTCMVQRHEQDARITFDLLECLQDLRRTRGCKNIAHHGDIQHAVSHPSLEGWFVSGPTQGDERHLVR